MNRVSIIQELINKNYYKSYLEIGVRSGDCFNAIQCDYKVGVDPDQSSAATSFLTSDEFFKIRYDHKFDIIFVDGLHHSDQVSKDLENSLNHLNKGGTIVMHDCLPTSKRMQEIPLEEQDEWTGDTWKAYVKLRMERNDVDTVVVDTDWGCGIITKKHPSTEGGLLQIDGPIDYEGFVQNRNVWMNVISCEEFKQRFL